MGRKSKGQVLCQQIDFVLLVLGLKRRFGWGHKPPKLLHVHTMLRGEHAIPSCVHPLCKNLRNVAATVALLSAWASWLCRTSGAFFKKGQTELAVYFCKPRH
ncbi:MAG: hypothetical protein EAY75_06690 [Bacteroidetes bacterium]|nr:MAG: hypothetical protein EAY75_06690 [Bacteroidota bacterium]